MYICSKRRLFYNKNKRSLQDATKTINNFQETTFLSHIIKDGVFVGGINSAVVRYIVVNINDIGALLPPGVEIANNLSR